MRQNVPPAFDDSFAHDLTRDALGSVQCFVCRRAVSKRSAYSFEHVGGPKMALHLDCLNGASVAAIVQKYHAALDEVLRDGATA